MEGAIVMALCTTLLPAATTLSVMTIIETVQSERMFKRRRRENEEMAKRHRQDSEQYDESAEETQRSLDEWKAINDKLARQINNMNR